MKFVPDFSHSGLKAWCIFCRTALSNQNASKEHVPSKVFLQKPYPENLGVIYTCSSCNNRFSLDEEYSAVVVSVMKSGNCDPKRQAISTASKIMERKSKLTSSLRSGFVQHYAPSGKVYTKFSFNKDRLDNVIQKNARTIALYEVGEGYLSDNATVTWWTANQIGKEERIEFEFIDDPDSFPEVGCRMLFRLIEAKDMVNGWVAVQPDIFRYALSWSSEFLKIRMVFSEFLFAEVRFAYGDEEIRLENNGYVSQLELFARDEMTPTPGSQHARQILEKSLDACEELADENNPLSKSTRKSLFDIAYADSDRIMVWQTHIQQGAAVRCLIEWQPAMGYCLDPVSELGSSPKPLHPGFVCYQVQRGSDQAELVHLIDLDLSKHQNRNYGENLLASVPVPLKTKGGKLAPEFFEWLLGYPIGWTDVSPDPKHRLSNRYMARIHLLANAMDPRIATLFLSRIAKLEKGHQPS